jgi:hypothetical protein
VPGNRGAASPATRAHSALEVVGAPHPRPLRKHGYSGFRSGSDSELLAALAAACRKHRPARAGTHPLAEAVDLRPPAVVRLERALAHWSSRYVRKLLRKMAGHQMAQPVNGRGDPGAGQTRRPASALDLPAGGSTIVEHRDFHNASAVGDLGCGKSTSAGRPAGQAAVTGWGNHGPAYVHTLWTDLWTTSCGLLFAARAGRREGSARWVTWIWRKCGHDPSMDSPPWGSRRASSPGSS